MITRFLDWLDDSAAGVIRVAYLLAGVIAVASYFSDGNVPVWMMHDLDAILPWVLAGALEIHTYLSARRVRAAWQDMQAATLGSDEYERAERSMRLNIWILGGLLAFSMYNQLQYLAINWRPPHTPLTPPGPLAYLVRAIITPAAFMAAAFLAPMGEGMAVQVQREAHHLARLAFKAASAQWKRRLRDMQRRNEDVTGALVQLVDDPTERRVIASIHAAMHATPIAVGEPPNDEPPTPPRGGIPAPAPAAVDGSLNPLASEQVRTIVQSAAETAPVSGRLYVVRKPTGRRRNAPGRRTKSGKRDTSSVRKLAEAVWHPGMTLSEMQAETAKINNGKSISRGAASKYMKIFEAEHTGSATA